MDHFLSIPGLLHAVYSSSYIYLPVNFIASFFLLLLLFLTGLSTKLKVWGL